MMRSSMLIRGRTLPRLGLSPPGCDDGAVAARSMPLGLMLGGLDAGWAFQPLQPGNLFALRRHHLPQRSDFGQQLHDQRLELGRVQRIRVERQWHPQFKSQTRREANRKMSAAAETAPTCDVFDSLDLAATCDARDFAGVTNPSPQLRKSGYL